MSDPKPIGHVLDAIGIVSSLPENALVTGAYVLIRYVNSEGIPVMARTTAGLDWFTQVGMLTTALDEERSGATTVRDA